MERTKAYNSNSKNIISYGWQDGGSPVLEVEFGGRKGQSAIYRYPGVPQSKWLGLMHAASAGAYLNSEIKPFYPAERVQ